jgi:hypothetical protein
VALKEIDTFGIAISESENHDKTWWVIYLFDWRKGKEIVHTACRTFKKKELRVIKVISPDEEPALFQAIKVAKNPTEIQTLLNMESLIKKHIPTKSQTQKRLHLPPIFA